MTEAVDLKLEKLARRLCMMVGHDPDAISHYYIHAAEYGKPFWTGYVKEASMLLSMAADGEAPLCKCGTPMSKNGHADAGKPFTLDTVGPVWVCVPCGYAQLDKWYRRAKKAEEAIVAAYATIGAKNEA